MGDDGGPQGVGIELPPGVDTVEWVNGSPDAQLWRLDYGQLGTVEFTLPIGGKVRLKVGVEPPRITINDSEIDIADGDNVTRLNKPD